MNTTSIKEILERNGVTCNRNPVLARRIAAELRARGYRAVTRRVNGRLRRLWVAEERSVKDLVDIGLGD